MTTALVLGGGGVAGVAWEAGIVTGLRREGVDLGTADVIVGTSAGAVIGTIIASGADLEQAILRQAEADPGPSHPVDGDAVTRAFAILADPNLEAQEARRRVGRMALAARVDHAAERLAAVGRHLPVTTWPERDLLITAVDAETGELVVWRKDSGVPLASAVASSCAVPMIFPPVEIHGRRYMDGGVRSDTNADLAVGADTVVVVEPLGHLSPSKVLQRELDHVQASRTHVIRPDRAAIDVFGTDVLNPALWGTAYRAGLAQAPALAEPLRKIWPA